MSTSSPPEPAPPLALKESLAEKRALVVEALRYIQRFAGTRAVIKYGGAAMIDPALKASFAQDMVLLMSAGLRPVIVHGGGPEISRTLDRLGQTSEFFEGQRITGEEDVRIVEMVLTGRVNTEIVGRLNVLGATAIGLSGKDARLLRARKLAPAPGKRDLGLVGEVESVNTEVLEMLIDKGILPVISPVGLAADGTSLNINADMVAAAIATALGARKLIYLTDVPGILDAEGRLLSALTRDELQALVGGPVKGGMHVKAQAIIQALEGGVQAVHVVDGRAPHSVVVELFTDEGVGTVIRR